MITDNLIIDKLNLSHIRSLYEYYDTNKEHPEKWEPKRTTNFYSSEYFENKVNKSVSLIKEGTSMHFVLFPKSKAQIIGLCNYTKINLTKMPSCYLGFSIAHNYQGKGLMFEALEKTNQNIFETFSLDRISAAHIPKNHRSEHLLNRLGFIRTSYEKEYLKINGKMEDHIVYALKKNDDYHKKMDR